MPNALFCRYLMRRGGRVEAAEAVGDAGIVEGEYMGSILPALPGHCLSSDHKSTSAQPMACDVASGM